MYTVKETHLRLVGDQPVSIWNPLETNIPDWKPKCLIGDRFDMLVKHISLRWVSDQACRSPMCLQSIMFVSDVSLIRHVGLQYIFAGSPIMIIFSWTLFISEYFITCFSNRIGWKVVQIYLTLNKLDSLFRWESLVEEYLSASIVFSLLWEFSLSIELISCYI